MNDASVLQLYPVAGQTAVLLGLYLEHGLRQLRPDAPFVYSNYVVSLDGRMALPHPSHGELSVPESIANRRDWRLFQELAAQADVIISSGRYLRQYAHGRAQEILQAYDDADFADLKVWRAAQGLRPYPDLAVLSRSLDFPIPPALHQDGRRLSVFAPADADPARQNAIVAQGAQLHLAPDTEIDGRWLINCLADMGYKTIYNTAGPKVLHLLLAADQLDRLYLTQAHRLLGGEAFSTIVEGALLPTAVAMRLHTLYLDPAALAGAGQLLLSYERWSPDNGR